MKYLIPASILALLLALSSCGVMHTFTSVSDESLARTFTGDSPQEKYIVKYAGIAVSERKRSGVPASITLAQGMLESGNGLSELAVKANNHFGIKCHDWKGAKMYYDDDRRGECFRKYRNPEESYKDHSDFLRYRDRYKFLFDFRVTDYKSWAYGLKKAGYATDPSYPQKLINIIEEYDLDRFDRVSHGKALQSAGTDSKPSGSPSGKENSGTSTAAQSAVTDAAVPATPAELETPKPLSDRKGKTMFLSLTRQLFSQNGVPFVYSVKGETYSDLARTYGLFLGEILRYNDLSEDRELAPGTIVYLQPKKSRAARQVDKYVAEGGETLRDIAQRYAVKMKSLMKINGLDGSAELQEGEMVLLRK